MPNYDGNGNGNDKNFLCLFRSQYEQDFSVLMEWVPHLVVTETATVKKMSIMATVDGVLTVAATLRN